MLVNLAEMLAEAGKSGRAVGAFNCTTLETARAAVAAAEELRVPVILQHAQVHEEYIPIELIGAIMLSLARRARVPVCVHLDHGQTLEYVARALRLGFTSVMYDASAKPMAENMAQTALVARMAHAMGVTVEAELGSVPACAGDAGRPEDNCTVPEDAARFAEETGVDALAIAFGTVHGVYRTAPRLNLDIVSEVSKLTGGLPLVMHGGSGLSDGDYLAAIARGVRKINYYTYAALAGGQGLYQAARETPQGLRWDDAAAVAAEWIRRDAARVMRLFSEANS